ncbi:helix-turn-helix transcriptional regulator [Collinsella ihumii]|uniref:Helix-turn-helix transcriptional regulator n=1 Tax=Collinsella ihumii TaxID=1720204 RepID=A0ABT7XEE7_9ACTN|nr:helix-turn-helix transcriptional regulator [Collinsella ihumii]MDN0063790.1 helix-turn-helix transcriptional regulator [Collinsella ihumii]
MSTRIKHEAMIIGSAIREHRVAAGWTQGELARRVYVTRQTVNNWEAGKTLPDTQSLRLLAEAFETSMDDLAGTTLPEIERAAEARHELLGLLARFAIAIIGCVVIAIPYMVLRHHASDSIGDSENSTYQGFWLLCSMLMFACAIWGSLLRSRIHRLMRKRDMDDAVALIRFLEGSPRRSPVPDTFLYRVVLPHWNVVWFLSSVVLAIIILLIALLLTI